MSERVLDASAFLAVVQEESYDQSLLKALEGAVISAVNIAEVHAKLSEIRFGYPSTFTHLMRLIGRVEPFTEAQARISGTLRPSTRALGLSLGDRACLALALDLGAEVYTMDRSWAKLEIGCAIHLMR